MLEIIRLIRAYDTNAGIGKKQVFSFANGIITLDGVKLPRDGSKMNSDLFKIISDIKNYINWDVLFLSNIPAIVTTAGGLLSVLKIIVDRLFLIDINGYILLHKIRDKGIVDQIKNWIHWACESFIIAFNQWIIAMVLSVFNLLANCRLECSYSQRSTVVLLILFTVMLYARGRKKIANGRLWCKLVKCVFDILCVFFLILFWASFILYERKIILLAIAAAYIEVVTATLCLFSKFGLYKNCKNCWIHLSRVIRYALMIGFYAYMTVHLKKISDRLSLWIFVAWQIWSLVDAICIYITDDTDVVNVVLQTRDGEDYTREKVIQHSHNKLEYKSIDGKRIIVDNDEIEGIVYKVRNGRINKKKQAKCCVECVERDGTIVFYQNYRNIKNEWYIFMNIDNGLCQVTYRKAKDVEKVIAY